MDVDVTPQVVICIYMHIILGVASKLVQHATPLQNPRSATDHDYGSLLTWPLVCGRLHTCTCTSVYKLHVYFFCLSSDPTLTTHNVMEMVKGVPYDYLHLVLSASFNKWYEIKTQYQSDEQRSEALISHVISTHPCLSWNLLASGLQRYGYSEAAAGVTGKYVKGELTTL